MRVDTDARRGKARFAGVLLCETPRFLRLPLLFPKNFALQIFFGIAADTKHAAQRYAIPSASPPYGLPGAAMIADEKAARQKTMKNNAFFMVFYYFDCEEENSGSDFIVLKKLMLK